jgi:hypothetical protein
MHDDDLDMYNNLVERDDCDFDEAQHERLMEELQVLDDSPITDEDIPG